MKKSTKCDYFAKVLGDNFIDEEIKALSIDLNTLMETLEKVPENARRMLLRFVSKSDNGDNVYTDEFATERYSDEGKHLEAMVKILQRYRLAEFSTNIDDESIIQLSCNNKSGINYWGDIKEFCKVEKIPLEQIIMDLNFAIFDGKEFVKKGLFDLK